jgi:hypothetical protein
MRTLSNVIVAGHTSPAPAADPCTRQIAGRSDRSLAESHVCRIHKRVLQCGKREEGTTIHRAGVVLPGPISEFF